MKKPPGRAALELGGVGELNSSDQIHNLGPYH